LGLSGAAFAQQQSASETSKEAIGTLLEEVVVTAQRREESLQEVPIAVTAITSETRELIGAITIEDITNLVPGFTYDGFLDRANIRGVGRVTNTPGSDPGVGLYVDGIYNSSTASLSRSSIFTDRVEVLRGPQGSLFGRNTTGGAISLVSRRPRDSFGAEGRMTYGVFDRRILEGTVTLPLSSWARIRTTAAFTNQGDGYFTNYSGLGDEGGRTEEKDFSGVMELDLAENLLLSMRYSRQDQERYNRFSATLSQPNYNLNMGTTSATSVSGAVSFQFGTFQGFQPNGLYNGLGVGPHPGIVTAETQYFVPNPTTVDNRRAFSANVPTKNVLDGSDAVSLSLTWTLPSVDLKYTGGFVSYHYYSWSDTDNTARQFYDYTPNAVPANNNTSSTVRVYTGTRFLFDESKDYWSNELTATSTGDGALSWLAGLYQYHEKYEQIPIATGVSNPNQPELHVVYARPAAVPADQAAYDAMRAAGPAYYNPNGMVSQQKGIVEVNTYAAFSRATWKITDSFSLTAGGRLSRDEKEGEERRFAVIWDPSVMGAGAVAFDNTPVNECYSPDGVANPFRSQFQSTVNVATGAEIPLTATSTSYASSCRKREFEKRTWDDWSGDLGIDWKPLDGLLTYLKYSRGYKSGALRVGLFSLDSETDPEHSNNYEAGIKYNFAKRYQLNTSLFLTDYRDYQFPIGELVDNGNGTTSIVQTYTNLEESQSYGAELEFLMNPWSTFQAILNYSYLHTEISTDLYLVDPNDPQGTSPDSSPDRVVRGTQVAQNVKGNSWPGQPNHKAYANLNYGFKFAAGSLTPSFNYSWRGPVSAGGLTVSAFSRERNKTPSYVTMDARVTWQDAKSRYRVIGYVANLTNNETANGLDNSSTVNGQPVQRIVLNPPRTYGLSLYYYFGSDRL
jgi:iron complex outermembrane receptor protein